MQEDGLGDASSATLEALQAPLNYWQAEMLASSAVRLADRCLTTRRQCPQRTTLPRGVFVARLVVSRLSHLRLQVTALGRMRPPLLSTEEYSGAVGHVGGLPNNSFLPKLAEDLLPRAMPRLFWD